MNYDRFSFYASPEVLAAGDTTAYVGAGSVDDSDTSLVGVGFAFDAMHVITCAEARTLSTVLAYAAGVDDESGPAPFRLPEFKQLFTVMVTVFPAGAFDDDGEPQPGWEPEGWLSDPDERAAWIERFGDARFFWPRSNIVYRSRSSAQDRVNLFRRYGATAGVLVCEPTWQADAGVRAAKAKARKEKKITALRAKIAELEAAS